MSFYYPSSTNVYNFVVVLVLRQVKNQNAVCNCYTLVIEVLHITIRLVVTNYFKNIGFIKTTKKSCEVANFTEHNLQSVHVPYYSVIALTEPEFPLEPLNEPLKV